MKERARGRLPDPIEPAKLGFPKSARVLRPSDFRRIYDEGLRVPGPLFTAFCRRREQPHGPRIGFTVPRGLGKAVVRNRIKRRIREAVRRQLCLLGPQWEIVINPRRAAFQAPFADIEREIVRLFSRCAGA